MVASHSNFGEFLFGMVFHSLDMVSHARVGEHVWLVHEPFGFVLRLGYVIMA